MLVPEAQCLGQALDDGETGVQIVILEQVQIQNITLLNADGLLRFIGVRSAAGHPMQLVLDPSTQGGDVPHQKLKPGDVVSVRGVLERRARVALKVDRVDVVERWSAVHPKPFVTDSKWFKEEWADVAMPAVVIQHESSHSSRLVEYLSEKLPRWVPAALA
jgi:hypothetical protein